MVINVQRACEKVKLQKDDNFMAIIEIKKNLPEVSNCQIIHKVEPHLILIRLDMISGVCRMGQELIFSMGSLRVQNLNGVSLTGGSRWGRGQGLWILLEMHKWL